MRNDNERPGDYFSFMAEKKYGKGTQHYQGAAEGQNTFTSSDVVEFIPEPQIEVTESVISDTMIQRVFGRFRARTPAPLED